MRKVLFITLIWAFLTLVFPGVIRQGVVYCNDQIPVKNAASCSQTEIQSGNVEYYFRYMAVGILFLLVGIIVVHRKDFSKKNTRSAQILLPIGLMVTLIYSWLVPPLVMYPHGELFAYVSHVPTVSYALGIALTAAIGLALGSFIGKRIMNVRTKSYA